MTISRFMNPGRPLPQQQRRRSETVVRTDPAHKPIAHAVELRPEFRFEVPEQSATAKQPTITRTDPTHQPIGTPLASAAGAKQTMPPVASPRTPNRT